MRFHVKAMRCENCGKQLVYFDVAYAYEVDTVEGVKWVCDSCKVRYNILNRLPKKSELNISWKDARAKARREGVKI